MAFVTRILCHCNLYCSRRSCAHAAKLPPARTNCIFFQRPDIPPIDFSHLLTHVPIALCWHRVMLPWALSYASAPPPDLRLQQQKDQYPQSQPVGNPQGLIGPNLGHASPLPLTNSIAAYQTRTSGPARLRLRDRVNRSAFSLHSAGPAILG